MQIPYDFNAEREILSTILVENKKIADAIDIIDGSDFYNSSTRLIFETMTKMFMENKNIDIINLSHEIGQENLKKIGGITFIAELSNSGFGSTDIKAYCNIVKEKSKRRTLIKAANMMLQKVYDDKNDIDDIIDEAQNTLISNVNKKTLIPDSDLMNKTLKEIEKRYQNGGAIPGMKTGLKTLDEATNGMKKGELVVIAARPSMGKTVTALNLADKIADYGAKVSLFEMEMTEEALGIRRLSYLTMIDGMRLQRGQLEEKEWDKLTIASGKISARNGLFTDTSTDQRVVDIKAKCKALKQSTGLDVVIIDHLGLMKLPKGERRDVQVGEVTLALKNMAKELDVCVILLCQLSRALSQRGDKRPMLTDLRDSGNIEQDADLVLGLHREEYYNPECEDKGILETLILKQRNGRVGTLKFAYIDKFQKIGELMLK